jgi:glycosyltransferase involved in cell wall biosynthesis
MTSARRERSAGRILFVSMYPIGLENTGPTVRIGHMLRALREQVAVDVIAGSRRDRRRAWLRFLRSDRLREVSGVYVETSSALPDLVDIAALGVAKRRGLKVLTYIRDAYQLFRDEFPPPDTWHGLVGRAFPLAIAALRRVSSGLAFPTRGLAEAVIGRAAAEEAVLLPPGSPQPVNVPRDPAARTLLFVGDLRLKAQGGDTLVEGVARARERGADLGLLCVVPAGGEPRTASAPWIDTRRASADEIPQLLSPVMACIVPRAPGRYNDLALPVKLMEYLAYGRPLVVTDRLETARLVRAGGAGIVVGDGPQAMADGLLELWRAPEERRDEWSRAAHRTALANAWPSRAETVLRILAQ